MKKMTVIKIAIVAIFLGIMVYKIYKMGAFDNLPEPGTIENKK